MIWRRDIRTAYTGQGLIVIVMAEWPRGPLMPETVTLQQNNLLAQIDCPVTALCLNTGDTLCIACYFLSITSRSWGDWRDTFYLSLWELYKYTAEVESEFYGFGACNNLR